MTLKTIIEMSKSGKDVTEAIKSEEAIRIKNLENTIENHSGGPNAKLDDTFNAAAYIERFNPIHTADGYKMEVIDFTGNLKCFFLICGTLIHTWDGENHCYAEDYDNIAFRYFKGIKDSLDRIPEAKRSKVLSHLYVVFKADSVFRYVSGAVQCHKATLYGMNPEGKGLIELGHSCFGNCKEKEE